MTHTTTVIDRLSTGDSVTVIAELDITSLDNAASENFDPVSEFALQGVLNVEVGRLENPNTYIVQAAADNDLSVETYGGTDPTAGTDVGTVRVSVRANPGP
jgi:hypothetical protein